MNRAYKSDVRRVLMTTDSVGGVWTFSLGLAEELNRKGIDVALAVLGGPSEEQQRQVRHVPGLSLYASAYKLEWMDDPWDDVAAACKWLLIFEREFAPDVIHLNSFCHGALPWHAPVILTAHSC